MTPAEWWLVFDARRTDRQPGSKPSEEEYNDMHDFLQQGKDEHELMQVAENGFNR